MRARLGGGRLGATSGVLLLCAAVAWAQEPKADQAKDAKAASTDGATLRIVVPGNWDGETLEMAKALLRSSQVRRAAFAAVAGVPREQVATIPDADLPRVDVLEKDSSGFGGSTLWKQDRANYELITVRSPTERVPAAKFLDAFAKALEAALGGLDKEVNDDRELERAQHAAESADMRYQASQRKLAELVESLGPEADLPEKLLGETIQRLITLQQDCELKSRELNARRRAIEQQIAVTGERVAKEAEGDQVLAELERVVDVRKARLARIRDLVKTSAVAQSELLEGEEQLALARAEWAKYRRQVADAVGNQQLQSLNSRLAETTIDMAENEERLKVLAEKLAAAQKVNRSELPKVRNDLVTLEMKVKELKVDADEARFRAANRPRPAVKVLRPVVSTAE